MTKQQLWQQRITDWQKRGLTQSAFCQQHGIALSTFNTWLRKIRNQSEQKRFLSPLFTRGG